MSSAVTPGDLRLISARKLGAQEYVELLERIRATVDASLPAHATLIVVSKGDEELLELGASRRAWHFPQTATGEYVGFHPASSADIIAHLEQLRAKGAEYLLIPSTAFWWLNYYGELTVYLQNAYRLAVRQDDTCLIFTLHERVSHRPDPRGDDRDEHFRQLRDVAQSLLPLGAAIAVASDGDDELLDLLGQRAMHFPCTGTGAYSRVALPDASTAHMHVETARANGAEFLIIPPHLSASTRYAGLRGLLRSDHRLVTRQRHVCEIWELIRRDTLESRSQDRQPQ